MPETVDITHQESAGQWRELLAGAGVRNARVTGSGIFKDAASDELVRSYVFGGTIREWQVVVPDFGTVEGRSRSRRSSSRDGTTARWRSSSPLDSRG